MLFSLEFSLCFFFFVPIDRLIVESKKKRRKSIVRENMANSKYEYVKSFEVEDEVMFPNLIIIRIHGRDFSR